MEHVLLVEDDPLNIIVFRKILERIGGFKVTCTEDVGVILELCHNHIVQLVIMDISLDNSYYQGKFIDGIEITKLIKSNPKSMCIPVILATAHSMEGDRKKYLKESGADGYISKPVTDHVEFIKTIKNSLSKEFAC